MRIILCYLKSLQLKLLILKMEDKNCNFDKIILKFYRCNMEIKILFKFMSLLWIFYEIQSQMYIMQNKYRTTVQLLKCYRAKAMLCTPFNLNHHSFFLNP